MFFQALLYTIAVVVLAACCSRIRSRSARQILLLVVSYGLYITWGWWFAIVLICSTLVNFAFGQSLRRKRSSAVLWTGIVFNVAVLSSFKYVPEIAHSFPVAWLQPFAQIALPLGLSFWTFQAMSYLFDLYGGEKLDPSLLEFALYMAFFPITISGPICRLPDMLSQFRSEMRVSRNDVLVGISRIATGIFMMQIAQLLGHGIVDGKGINYGFDQMTTWSGPDVWCLAAGYGLQLFFDFAGYSHLAIGVAKVIGFTVPENFNRPYVSTTPSVFWTRWHMSLSFWIRDYVFVPMAMMRAEQWWFDASLLISMVIFGLWHKGTVLFLLFGCYQGLLLIGHRQAQAIRKRSKALKRKTAYGPLLSGFLTIVLITLGWIFFRANSLAEAGQMFRALATPGSYADISLPVSLYAAVAALIAGYALVLFAIDALGRYAADRNAKGSEVVAALTQNRLLWLAPPYAFALLITILLIHHLPQNGPGPFMYAGY